jgi:transketolase
VEEHTVIGGLGAAVAEAVTNCYPVPVKRVGLQDQFAETGPYDSILEAYGLGVTHILQAAHQALALKGKAK